MEPANDALAHFGVLGMKWGRRSANTKRSISPGKAKRLDKKIAKHEAAIKSSKERMKTFEKDALDLQQNGHKSAPMARRYGRSVDQSYVGFTLTNGINRIDAVNQLFVETGMNIRSEQRALKRNEKRLNKLKAIKKNSVVKHEDEVAGEFLEHFGVKGMHWGQRKAARTAQLHKTISEDARNAGDAFAKSKSVGLHSLSNKELQDMVTRLNLEQQFTRLQPESKKKAAAKFVANTLISVGKTEATKLATNLAAKEIGKLLAKR